MSQSLSVHLNVTVSDCPSECHSLCPSECHSLCLSIKVSFIPHNYHSRDNSALNRSDTQIVDVPPVEFTYPVFARMPGENCRRCPRSLLCLCDIFQALVNPLFVMNNCTQLHSAFSLWFVSLLHYAAISNCACVCVLLQALQSSTYMTGSSMGANAALGQYAPPLVCVCVCVCVYVCSVCVIIVVLLICAYNLFVHFKICTMNACRLCVGVGV